MKGKTTEIELPSGDNFHHYLLASDFHGEYLDEHSYSILKAYAKTLPKFQRNLIINGDLVDASFLMKKHPDYSSNARRSNGIQDHFLPLANKEFDLINWILDDLLKVFSTIIYIEGNHCARYQKFLESKDCPFAYRDDFDLQKRLKLAHRNILFIRYNNWLDIGKLAITHGMWNGKDAKQRHYMTANKSVVFGDVHRGESESFATRDTPRKVWTLPAMCQINAMDYMENKDNNWTRGFGHLIVKSNGYFQMNIHEIWDDNQLIVGNKILK